MVLKLISWMLGACALGAGVLIVLGVVSFLFGGADDINCGHCGHTIFNIPGDMPVVCPNCEQRT